MLKENVEKLMPETSADAVPAPSPRELVRLDRLCYSYGSHQVLKNISASFLAGKIYAIVGRSGAGKTTLLSVMSGLTDPTSGSLYVNGEDIRKEDKYIYRSHTVGVIFQSYNLLNKLTALENVVLSMEISLRNQGTHYDRAALQEEARRLLDRVGLTPDEMDRRVLKLSGGQQQRVAIARALACQPDILLADEPTGSLDQETQAEIMTLLKDLAREGKCVIIVTHSPEVAGMADEQITLTQAKKTA